MNSLKQLSLLMAVSFSLIANNIFAQIRESQTLEQKETQKTPLAKSNSEKEADFTQAEIDELADGMKNTLGEVKLEFIEVDGMDQVYVEKIKKTYMQTAKEINAFQAAYPNSKSKIESLTLLQGIIKKVDSAAKEVYEAQHANVTYTAINKADIDKAGLKYNKYLTQLYNTYEAKKKE